MAAITYDFLIEEGSDFKLNFQYNNEKNNPIDLTSKCVILQIKPSLLSSSGCLYGFSSNQPDVYNTKGFLLRANNSGLITFKLSAGFISKEFATFSSALYELDILDPILSTINNQQNTRLATGSITIQKRNISLPIACLGGDNPCVSVISSVDNNPSTTPESTSTTPTVTPTPTNTPGDTFQDLCLPTDCLNTVPYSVVYSGSLINISDSNTTIDTIVVEDTRSIENLEVVIDKLNHTHPQDIQLFLAPPSGNKILLSANHKITNYTNNFSFMFSNKALPTTYLYNMNNGDYCNIYPKTHIVKYSNETLSSNFDHLFGHAVTGDWSLIVRDTDPLSSGSIDSWKLVITYSPNIIGE